MKYIWRDPPTIHAAVERMKKHPGRWMFIESRRTENAAACKASEFRRKFPKIKWLVVASDIYACSPKSKPRKR